MAFDLVQEFCSYQMETCTKVGGRMVKKTAKEHTGGQMELFTRARGRMIHEKV